jgi:hypothetical protein
MKRLHLFVLLSVLLLSLACQAGGGLLSPEANDMTPGVRPDVVNLDGPDGPPRDSVATPTVMPASPTATQPAPTLVEPTQPAVNPTASGGSGPTGAGEERDLPMTIAGADFFALGVADEHDINNEGLTAGWLRITEAGNRDYCAWSNQFKLEVSSGVMIQIPHCLEWRMTGSGNVKVTFKPDNTRGGYDTSDTLGTGLAWWPAGANGSYRVTRNGSTTEWIPLTTGPEGVNFPKNGSEVTIEFSLENAFVTMPLGEIRNNVLPQY